MRVSPSKSLSALLIEQQDASHAFLRKATSDLADFACAAHDPAAFRCTEGFRITFTSAMP